jgi:TyrR family helix-turn-helix protein
VANNELNEIIELSADGLVSLDHTGVILGMNKAYEKIVGINAQDYLGNDWPGNVREIENAIERFVVLSDEMFIDSAVLAVEAGGERVLGDDQAGLRNLMESAEKEIILNAYRECGSTRRMAQRLNTSQATIVRKLKKHRAVRPELYGSRK